LLRERKRCKEQNRERGHAESAEGGFCRMDDLKIVRRHAAIRNVKESGTEKSVPNGTRKMKNIFEQIICKKKL
jgi:hypothetical protein